MSNALGILRHMNFCDKLPGSIVTENEALTDAPPDSSPEEVKLRCDGKLMIPCMDNFFTHHPDFTMLALAADSWFDYASNYKYLFKEHNIFPIIDLNPKNAKMVLVFQV